MKEPNNSIMMEAVVTVSLNDNAEAFEKIMDTKNLSCIPVIDTDGKCVPTR